MYSHYVVLFENLEQTLMLAGMVCFVLTSVETVHIDV